MNGVIFHVAEVLSSSLSSGSISECLTFTFDDGSTSPSGNVMFISGFNTLKSTSVPITFGIEQLRLGFLNLVLCLSISVSVGLAITLGGPSSTLRVERFIFGKAKSTSGNLISGFETPKFVKSFFPLLLFFGLVKFSLFALFCPVYIPDDHSKESSFVTCPCT